MLVRVMCIRFVFEEFDGYYGVVFFLFVVILFVVGVCGVVLCICGGCVGLGGV